MKVLNCLLGATLGINTNPDKPNILFILSDDQGFSDVPWKNSKVQLPNLEKLTKKGMIIDGAYSQSRCTPSRASFMTGKYPWKIGIGQNVFQVLAKNGIRPSETLLPELMKNQGYDTHMYGKWHLGYCDEALLPHNRGFDTFRGFWAEGGTDYYQHTASSGGVNFLDNWINGESRPSSGIYTTDEYANDFMALLDERVSTGDTDPFFTWLAFNAPHSPFEVPSHSIPAEYDNIPNNEDANRDVVLGMIYRLDMQIGRIITKLEQTGEIDNTIIVFQSDNGPNSPGSAFPLRGKKGVLSEGGIRVPSLIFGPNIPAGTTLHRTNFMHLTDWSATFLDYAGADLNNIGVDLDGHSFKDVFENGDDSPRTDLFHMVTPGDQPSGVYRKGDYKLVYRFSAVFNQGNGPSNHTAHDEGICDPDRFLDDADYTLQEIFALSNTLQVTCMGNNANCRKFAVLYNIKDDPYELVNICDQEQTICNEMIDDITAAADSVADIPMINTDPAEDEATTLHENHPYQTGVTSWGWCDASLI